MKTRRGTAIGLAGAGVALAAGALWRFTDVIVKHYPPTPYDDVLARLQDRAQAIRLGKAALHGLPGFTPAAAAASLRAAFGAGGLSVAATIDAVNGNLAEAGGWVLPQSVVLLSALAARVSG